MDKSAKRRLGVAALAIVLLATLLVLHTIAAQSPSVSSGYTPLTATRSTGKCPIKAGLQSRPTQPPDRILMSRGHRS